MRPSTECKVLSQICQYSQNIDLQDNGNDDKTNDGIHPLVREGAQ